MKPYMPFAVLGMAVQGDRLHGLHVKSAAVVDHADGQAVSGSVKADLDGGDGYGDPGCVDAKTVTDRVFHKRLQDGLGDQPLVQFRGRLVQEYDRLLEALVHQLDIHVRMAQLIGDGDQIGSVRETDAQVFRQILDHVRGGV